MGILKTLTVSHRRKENGNYCVLLQKVPAINQPCLIFEAGTVISLDPEEADSHRRSGGYTKILDGYACLGMLQYAYEGSREVLFMVIVTGCSSVGKIANSEVFCISDVALLSMRNGSDDQQLVHSLKKLLSSGSFYFSHSCLPDGAPYDLTLTAQRAHMTKTTDNRFFWNRLLHRHFERFNVNSSFWLVKAMCGGVNISTVYVGGLQAKACIISRLSCERAGTRFNTRGTNDLGHVANFVESEQVIFLNQTVVSFLLCRGSIPLFWEQPGVQVGGHRIKMSRGTEISQPAYDKHMFLLRERYENVAIVNLLSLRESELNLNHLFRTHHEASRVGSEFPFINFDWHTRCPRGTKSTALDDIWTMHLKEICDQFKFFHAEKGTVQQIQRGVIRVNCLDCLDRTNAMQTFIASKVLARMVRSLDRVDVNKVLMKFYDIYDILWSQNGDQISRIYTGTGALDGKNLLKDGTLSVARTIQNNLLDTSKQCAFDILILGRTLDRDYSYRAASLLPHYFMYASPTILVNMCDRYLDYCSPGKIKVAVATWNVNGGKHFENIMHNRARPISDWLVDYHTSTEYGPKEGNLLDQTHYDSPPDIYAIGFQEIVDLNASNIVASSTQNQRAWLSEIQKTISRKDQYYLVTSVQLVGVCLFVFIKAEVAPHIRDVCIDQVKTGLGGATGNKGGVAVRFRYKATSLCFVCAHFAAGQHQVKERNDDYAEITRKIQFPMGRSINSHDYVFWCGDFNYRLDKISNEDARRAALGENFDLLLQHDQLKLSQVAGRTFKDYIEGEIKFPPTYKYDVNSTDYDTGEKCRMPAYTDRILFKKRHRTHIDEDLTDPSQIKFYNRIELMSSDHRPVIAEYEIEVLDVDKAARNLVLDCVLNDCGPPDSTIFVQIDGHLKINDDEVIAAIIRILADEAGEIVLLSCLSSSLMIIFSEGKAAVKAMHLNGHPLGPHFPDSKLIINLRTSDWREAVRAELMSNMDNTVNLISGLPPKVHLEDDEDEAAEELNMSLGPEVNPNAIWLNQELYMHEDHGEVNTQIEVNTADLVMSKMSLGNLSPIPPPIPPKSPTYRPMRPPPRPPTGRFTNPPSRPNKMEVQFVRNSPRHSDKALGFFTLPTTASETRELSAYGESSLNQLSVNLMELSSMDDPPMLPPPTMTPPVLPPLTPTRPSPNTPVFSPIGQPINRPSRAAPPPPIPSRHTDWDTESSDDEPAVETATI